MGTAVDYESFIATVRDEAHVTDEEAERAACATLQTLAQRILPGETEDLAERLPDELHACLPPADHPEPFHVDEFLHRIADRAGVDDEEAEQFARAVFVALWRAVGPDEFADVRAELPKDFEPLLDAAVEEAAPEGPSREVVTYDEFVDLVARRLSGDRSAARRAIEAVLEVFAMRIADGQVEDVEPLLPARVRPALERGRATTDGRALPLALEGFLAEVARRLDVSPQEAEAPARAVISTLRQILPDKEWEDTKAQLPTNYRVLWRDAAG